MEGKELIVTRVLGQTTRIISFRTFSCSRSWPTNIHLFRICVKVTAIIFFLNRISFVVSDASSVEVAPQSRSSSNKLLVDHIPALSECVANCPACSEPVMLSSKRTRHAFLPGIAVPRRSRRSSTPVCDTPRRQRCWAMSVDFSPRSRPGEGSIARTLLRMRRPKPVLLARRELDQPFGMFTAVYLPPQLFERRAEAV